MSTAPASSWVASALKLLRRLVLTIWHAPGRTCRAALAAASVTTWMRFGAIVIATLVVEQHVWIVWKGPWPEAAWKARLDWLGMSGALAWVVVLVGIVALWDFKLNLRAGREGLQADMSGDHDVQVRTTTTVSTPGGDQP